MRSILAASFLALVGCQAMPVVHLAAPSMDIPCPVTTYMAPNFQPSGYQQIVPQVAAPQAMACPAYQAPAAPQACAAPQAAPTAGYTFAPAPQAPVSSCK